VKKNSRRNREGVSTDCTDLSGSAGLHGFGKQKGEDKRTARKTGTVSADFADDAEWKRKKEKQKIFNAEDAKGAEREKRERRVESE